MVGGYTFKPPLEDRHYWTKSELKSEISVMLGGRAAEELKLVEVTTGAQNDLEMGTQMARKMVTQFGMSEKLGNVTLGKREGLVFLGRDLMEERNYSDTTARLIDEEVKKIVDDAYNRAKELLSSHIEKLTLLSEALLEKEVLNGDEVRQITGLKKPDDVTKPPAA
jgi:cell division protease FtsH